MKNENSTIKNNFTFIDLFNHILFLIFIPFVIHFVFIFPFSDVEKNKSAFEPELIKISLLISIPFQLLYIYSQYKNYKNNKANTAYLKADGIDYYKEKLKGVSPALMSFLINLELEEEKDIAATLLYYEKNSLIEIVNDEIIQNPHNLNLIESDKKFFEYLNDKTIDNYNLWKESVIQEAINSGYVKKKGTSTLKKLLLKRKITIAVLIIIFLIALCYLNIQQTDTGLNMTNAITEQSPMLISYIVMLFSLFLLIVTLASGKSSVFEKGSNLYKKTIKGTRLTEQINALKRFIQAFTKLEEETKNELVKWNEFLIYTPILEEDTQIVEEITTYKKL